MNLAHQTEAVAPVPGGRFPSLDGWRAVSVTLVLIAHASVQEARIPSAMVLGSTGVWFFFVISGFLITSLLLREKKQYGRIDYYQFILRRMIRIMPVYIIFLFFAYLFETQYQVQASPKQWIANLTFTANYSETKGITGHLWSLSVEEQFYILWPLALVILCKRVRHMTVFLTTIIAIAPIARGAAYLIGRDHLPWFLHRFSFLVQADGLAMGCLAAALLARYPHGWLLIARSPYRLTLAGAMLCLFPFAASGINGANFLLVPLGKTSQALGFLMLMSLSIVLPSHPLFRWLNLRVLIWIGTLSYSIYIWHLPFAPSKLLETSLPFNKVVFAYLLLSFLTAIVSYYFVEKPFLRLKPLIARIGRTSSGKESV